MVNRKLELSRAERHVHNFMMDTQLTKRVGTLHDIHKKDISTYKQNCGKMCICLNRIKIELGAFGLNINLPSLYHISD